MEKATARQLFSYLLIILMVKTLIMFKSLDVMAFYVNLILATFMDMSTFISLVMFILSFFSLSLLIQEAN